MEPRSHHLYAVSQGVHSLAQRDTQPTQSLTSVLFSLSRLSGLSPFLGDDDNETLNNILACEWNFEEVEFKDVSDEAKDFITRLLVKSKSWRMSATESLKHPWLSDRSLHYQLHQKVDMKLTFRCTLLYIVNNEKSNLKKSSHCRKTSATPPMLLLQRARQVRPFFDSISVHIFQSHFQPKEPTLQRFLTG